MSDAAPPGWYRHESSPGYEHWWDGTRYSQSRPIPQVQHYVAAVPAGVSPKSRTVAAVLGFFLGWLGVDRFYLGNVGLGVAKLLVGWLTLGIWPLVDWIIILAGAARDGDGLPVTRWE